MKPSEVFYKTRTDRHFLLNDYLSDTIMLTCFCILFFIFRLSGGFGIQIANFLFIPIFVFAIIFGWLIAAYLHKSGHGNLKSEILNKVVGEFCGHFVGYGYRNFIFIHTLHHIYSDKEFDPVSPKNMKFFTFLVSPIKYMIKEAKGYLRFTHGHHHDFEFILKRQTTIFYLNMILRQLAWLLLFGPLLYVCFYLPAVLSNIAILAHINFVCHRDQEDGNVEIYNLNHNSYYKFANFITRGGYFHKNHHLNMNLFDPRTYAKDDKRILALNSQNNFSLKAYFDLANIWGEKST